MKAAGATVTTTPGLAEALEKDWQKAAMFYARFEITEMMFRGGVPSCEALREPEKDVM